MFWVAITVGCIVGQERNYKMSVAEEGRLTSFLPKSVTVGTAAGYVSGMALWVEYIDGLRGKAEFPGKFMENIQDDEEKAKRLVLFYEHLYSVEGLRAEQVVRASTCVRYFFGVKGLPTERIFNSDIAARGRAAAQRSVSEKRARAQRMRERKVLPLSLELVLHIRRKYWVESSWEVRDDVDRKAVWLAICLGFDSGKRVGNLTLRDGNSRQDHCLRANSVLFRFLITASGEDRTIPAGTRLREQLASIGHYELISICLHYDTTKTVANSVVLEADEAGDAVVMEDLLEWVLKSGVEENDELLTRYWMSESGAIPSRKVVTRKAVREAIKETCKSFGLDEKRFSTKSMRSGFASAYKACGEEDADRNALGGWARSSKVPDKHYTTKKPIGAMSLGAGLSIGDLLRA